MYAEARISLKKGKTDRFKNLLGQLVDYPLYPYLLYNYIHPRIGRVDDFEISAFLNDYPDFLHSENLRTKWLKHLARKGKWQTYYDHYKTQADEELQCLQLQARININQQTYLLEDIRSVWLAGKSLPKSCDPAFKLLYDSHLMNDDLIWQRLGLAMNNGKIGLARFLARRLDKSYAEWANQWFNMHANPHKGTTEVNFNDSGFAHEILLYGIQKLARINLDRAINNWEKLQNHYSFTPQQISETNQVLAVRAAKRNHPKAKHLLDNIHDIYVNDDIFHWRLIYALNKHDWHILRTWTNGVPPFEEIKPRWYYWHARALEQTGDIELAKKFYTEIARERDYYGFLAADRLGQPYQFNYKPIPRNQDEIQKVLSMPGIQRAYELLAIDEQIQARREWHHALTFMTSFQKETAAIIAKEWDWLDRVIFTMGSAKSYDDLVLRFPIKFQDIIDKHISKNQLDTGWVYALIRSESAFVEDARSPAGALGLMQVMPRTGRDTARNLGWKFFNKKDLLKADKNVPLGSAYLKQMLKRFNDNKILATAAYNAGPHRVKQWLPRSDCIDSDIWVEKIPFNETRKYVRRVLFYASIYDWRLQREITPIKMRMAAIHAGNNKSLTGLDCNGKQIGYAYN